MSSKAQWGVYERFNQAPNEAASDRDRDAWKAKINDHSFIYSQKVYGNHISSGHPVFDLLGPPSVEHSMPERTKYSSDEGGLHPCYIGGNLFVRDTVNNAIVATANFYTTVLLPFQHTSDLNIKWDVSRMDRSLVDTVPTEGVSKIIKSSKYSMAEKLERRGLAMQIEKDFFATPEGVEHFRNEMAGIVQAVQNTLNLQAMATLVHNADRSNNAQQIVQTRSMQGSERIGVNRLVQRELSMYAILQTTERAAETLLQFARERMQRFGFQPTAFVLPPGAQHYLSFSNERTIAAIGGPGIEQQFETCCGIPVYSAEYIETSPGLLACPLVQHRSVGEYYHIPMDFRTTMDGDAFASINGMVGSQSSGESLDSRAILHVYDEESDFVRKVSLKTVIEASKRLRDINEGKGRWEDDTMFRLEVIAQWANTTNIAVLGVHTVAVSPDPFVTRCLAIATGPANEDPTKYSGDLAAILNTAQYHPIVSLFDLDVDLWGFFTYKDFSDYATRLGNVIENKPADAVEGNYYEPSDTEQSSNLTTDSVVDKWNKIVESFCVYAANTPEQPGLLRSFTEIIKIGSMLKDECVWAKENNERNQMYSVKRGEKKRRTDPGKSTDTKVSDKALDVDFLTTVLEDMLDVEPHTERLMNSMLEKKFTRRFMVRLFRIVGTRKKSWDDIMLDPVVCAFLEKNNSCKAFSKLLCRPVVIRPFITHNMGSVLVVDGKNAGSTFIGNNDFKLTDDNVTDNYYGNLTFYSKSVVTNPEAVQLFPATFSCGYMHGNCIKPYVPSANTEVYSRDEEDPHTVDRGSLICLLVPPNSKIDCSTNDGFDITGVDANDPELTETLVANPRLQHEQGAYLFSLLNGSQKIRNRPIFHGLHTGSRPSSFMPEDPNGSSRTVSNFSSLLTTLPIYEDCDDEATEHEQFTLNTLCFRGPCVSLSAGDSTAPTEQQKGSGHWKSKISRGSAQGRSGLPCAMDDMCVTHFLYIIYLFDLALFRSGDPLRGRLQRFGTGGVQDRSSLDKMNDGTFKYVL